MIVSDLYFRNISFETFEVIFPFNYNFAECFEEVRMVFGIDMICIPVNQSYIKRMLWFQNKNYFNFFSQFINLFKWWKLVHKVQRKQFTLESKLPPDLKIKAKVRYTV